MERAKGSTERRKNPWSGVLIIAATAALVLFVLTVIIGAPVLSSFDKSHLETMECTVTKATGSSDRFNSNSVVFETLDCGRLGFSVGVTRENSGEIASSIQVGERYIFEIGAATRATRGFFQTINITPAVYSFRKL